MTEPSGQGAFAEAMRELIADLRPRGAGRLRLVRGAGRARSLTGPPRRAGRAQLRLLQGS